MSMDTLQPTDESICFPQMKYGDACHPLVAFEKMNEMRKSGQLCDIILHVSNTDLAAHKVVLAATSAYFSAMFNSEYICCFQLCHDPLRDRPTGH